MAGSGLLVGGLVGPIIGAELVVRELRGTVGDGARAERIAEELARAVSTSIVDAAAADGLAPTDGLTCVRRMRDERQCPSCAA